MLTACLPSFLGWFSIKQNALCEAHISLNSSQDRIMLQILLRHLHFLFNNLTFLCLLSPHLNPLQSGSRDCLVCPFTRQNWQLIPMAQKVLFHCLCSVVSEPCHRISAHFSEEPKCCRGSRHRYKQQPLNSDSECNRQQRSHKTVRQPTKTFVFLS